MQPTPIPAASVFWWVLSGSCCRWSPSRATARIRKRSFTTESNDAGATSSQEDPRTPKGRAGADANAGLDAAKTEALAAARDGARHAADAEKFEDARAKDKETGVESAVRCVSTLARIAELGLVLCSLYFWRANCSFPSSAYSPASQATLGVSVPALNTARSRRSAALAIVAGVVLNAANAGAADTAAPACCAAIEVRSADLLLVGVVHGNKHSREPAQRQCAGATHDRRGIARIDVLSRAEADGGYSAEQGFATARRRGRGVSSESGRCTRLSKARWIANSVGQGEDKNNARQLWWWVLNFAVCFGILWLISRRRKAAQT